MRRTKATNEFVNFVRAANMKLLATLPQCEDLALLSLVSRCDVPVIPVTHQGGFWDRFRLPKNRSLEVSEKTRVALVPEDDEKIFLDPVS